MAVIVPSHLPDGTRSVGERIVFDALRQGLPDEWTVIHSLAWLDDRNRDRLREGECDFIILHPAHGMLAVETKSGDVKYVGLEKEWRHADGTPMKDPFLQAQSSAHYLNAYLAARVPAWAQIRPPFGHCVALPEADGMTGALPPHVTPDVLITRVDLAKLEVRVTQVLRRFARHATPGLSPSSTSTVCASMS